MENKKILRLGIFAIILLSVFAIFVSAYLPNPVITITANPKETTSSSVITAVAVDLSGKGIDWIKIYENGNLMKECNKVTSCSYVGFCTSPGIRNYYAKVRDNNGGTATSATISVNYINSAPVLDMIGNKEINEGENLVFQISASDFNNDPLTYSASNLPSGASFNANTRTFSWTPSYTQSGTYQVTFRVSDGKLSDEETITIRVNDVPVNNPPVLDAIGDKVIEEGQLLQFTINANDPDGDILTYSASNLPSGASFNANTRTFSWTPSYTQSGTYQVTFRVSDGKLEDSETISIIVNDFDDGSPRYSNITEYPGSPATYAPNQTYKFGIAWEDIDGVSDVWIVFNGIRYVPVSNGNSYYFEISNLGAGSYSYEWHANDTKGNENSVSRVFIINKAVPVLSISIRPDTTVEEDTETTVTGEGCPVGLICTLYRNGAVVNNPDVSKLSKGDYDYVYNTTGNENYTSANITKRLIVIEDSGSGRGDGGTREVYDIDDGSLENGYSRWLKVGDMLKFRICEQTYFIKLSELTSTKATIKITPNLITDTLKESESKSYDLQGDAIKDILVKIENIDYRNKKAKIFVMRLSTSVCKIQGLDKTEGDIVVLNERAITKPETPFYEYLVWGLIAGILLELLIIIIGAIIAAGARNQRRVQKPLPNYPKK